MWLAVSVGGYFLNALAAIIDKILLGKSIPNPRVYAFYIAVLGLIAFVIAPWGFSMVSPRIILLSLFTGFLFVAALVFFFSSLKMYEASRVVPLVGGIQPIGILLLSFLFLGERLALAQFAAFFLLIIGGIIISFERTKGRARSKRWFWYALAGGLLFSGFYTLTKYIFIQEDFVNGFLWPRIGSFVVALFLLLGKKTRKDIKNSRSDIKAGAFGAFLFGQTSGALSFVLINYSISIASVTLVNALQGVQYAFVFLLALLPAFKYPKFLTEKLTAAVILQKTLAILLIAGGIVLLNF